MKKSFMRILHLVSVAISIAAALGLDPPTAALLSASVSLGLAIFC